MPDTFPATGHDAARSYARLGWPILPLRGKVPAISDWQKFVANEVNVRFWFGSKRSNIGLRTGESGYLVVDTDTDAAEAWVRRHLPESPMKVRSGNGSLHRYFSEPPRKEVRNRQGLNGIRGLDVRGWGGYIVVPPSIHPVTGKPYEFLGPILRPELLPRFSPEWLRQRTRRTVIEAVSGEASFLEYRARRWLEVVARESPATSGQGGHNATFRVAMKLVGYFGLGQEAAVWLMMAVYNPHCRPPWRLQDVEKKVRDAAGKTGA